MNDETIDPARYWDEWWIAHPDGGEMGAANTNMLVPLLAQRRARRVLCVGNGKSLEAHLLVAEGFEVDTLDVSAEANSYLATMDSSKAKAAWPFRMPLPEFQGAPSIHIGDIRDTDACPGPFDAIIIRRTLQYYEDAEASRILDGLWRRLSETGLLVLEDHNAKEAAVTATNWLRDRRVPVAHNVVVRDGKGFAPPQLGNRLDCRVAWIIRSSG